MEPTLKYHPDCFGNLTYTREPGGGHCLVGSLTGAVASQKVTEAREGSPQPDWKPGVECKDIRGIDCESDETSRYESRSLVIRWLHMEGPSLNG